MSRQEILWTKIQERVNDMKMCAATFGWRVGPGPHALGDLKDLLYFADELRTLVRKYEEELADDEA